MSLVVRTTGVEDYLDGGEARVKCLILGAPGVGKTRSASFWPKPILLDCEDGRMSVADRSLPYVRIESSADMKAMLERINVDSLQPVDKRKYETVIIDTLDSYQRIVTAERLAITKNEGLTGWADWGYLDGKMQQLVYALQTMKINVVVNLHVKQTKVGGDENGDGAYMEQGPKLKGDMREQIGAEFDLVGYMGTYFEVVPGVTPVERRQMRGIQWHPTPDRPGCKDRSGQLPKFTTVTFTDEDYQQLFWPMKRHAEELSASREVETVATTAPPQPVGPLAGGPVGPKVAAPPAPAPAVPVPPAAGVQETPTAVVTPAPAAAPAPAVPAEAPTPATSARNVPAAPRPDAGASPAPAPAAPAPPAPEPVAEAGPPPTEAEAMATVVGTLGAEVIPSEAPADEPVVTPEPAPVAAQPEPAPAPAAPTAQAEVKWPHCGDAAVEGSEPLAAGCGKELKVRLSPNVSEDPSINADLVEIGVLKHRAWLCNEDFRAANQKG